MKFDFLQSDFSGGEISPRAQGHADSELFKTCAAKMSNCIPTEQGSFQSRAGLARANAVPGWEQAVKVYPVQDSPLGDIVLEISSGSLRMLDKRGQALPWNGLLWDFEAPQGQNQLGPSPTTAGPSGWYFVDTTGEAQSYVDPVDNKVCLRNRIGFGSVSAIAGGPGIPVSHGYPAGTGEGFQFRFTFSGSPVTVSIKDNLGGYAAVDRFTTPGDQVVGFTPEVGATSFVIIVQSDPNSVSASNVWGFSLIKDGMVTSGAFTPPSSPPSAWLNQVHGDSFWVETNNTATEQIFISPASPGMQYNPRISTINFSATGGSGIYTWSCVSSYGSTIDPVTGVFTVGISSGAGWVDYVTCTDSAGGSSTVSVTSDASSNATIDVNPHTMGNLYTGQTLQLYLTSYSSSKFSSVFWTVAAPAYGSIDPVTGIYTAPSTPSPADTVIVTFINGNDPTHTFSHTLPPTVIADRRDYFFTTLALAGQATPIQLVYRSPQPGDAPLLQQWSLSPFAVQENIGPANPLPPLSDIVAMTYYQSRLFLGFNNSFGNIAASQTGPAVNVLSLKFSFQTSTPALSTDAINLKLDTPKGKIVWMNVLRGLILGTTRNEKVFSSGVIALDTTTGQVFSISDESSIGSDPALVALDVGDKIAFFTHGRRSMRLAGIDIQSSGGLVAEDPGALGEHLLYRRVRSFCLLRAPVQRLVFAFDDGTMAIAMLKGAGAGGRQQLSWSEMTLPLPYKAFCVAALDSDDGSTLWVGTEGGQSLLVTDLDSRHKPKYLTLAAPVGQSSQRQEFDVEQMPPIMDGWVRRPVTSSGVVPGLPSEFSGLSCAAIVNGVYLGQFATSTDGSGRVSLTVPIASETLPGQPLTPTEAFVGVAYSDHEVELLPLEGGNPMGTAQGLKSRKVQCYLRLVDSYLPMVNGMQSFERQPGDVMDGQAARITGDRRTTELGFKRGSQLVISQPLPLRVEVSAVFGGTQVNQF